MFTDRTQWKARPSELTRLTEGLRQDGAAILDLTETNPTACGFSAFSPAMLEALRNPVGLQYRPLPNGLAVVRDVISRVYAEAGTVVDPAHIFLTSGTSEAYSFLFRWLLRSLH